MRKNFVISAYIAILTIASLAIGLSCKSSAGAPDAAPVALELKVPAKFTFIAFGDTRFHDPSDTKAASAEYRQAIVAAIDQVKPAFVSIGGDIVYNGDDSKDWQEWDLETSSWRAHNIKVYPALGNHDLHGDQKSALSNYFARFPELQGNRFYSVRMGNSLMLVLDSALEELSGPQGDWLHAQLDHIPANVDFVFFVFHHPPYTSSNDDKLFGGGHSIRSQEHALGEYLEQQQAKVRARFVVFNGHVHNYERHSHGGVLYFVTGGGGAHAYPVPRAADDPFQDKGVNYHYLAVDVNGSVLKITMNKVELKDGKAVWTQPDSVTVTAPAALPVAAD